MFTSSPGCLMDAQLPLLQHRLEAVGILRALSPLISVRKEAADSALIASGPTPAQWSADKAAGQQRPHFTLREDVISEPRADQKTSEWREFTWEFICIVDFRLKENAPFQRQPIFGVSTKVLIKFTKFKPAFLDGSNYFCVKLLQLLPLKLKLDEVWIIKTCQLLRGSRPVMRCQFRSGPAAVSPSPLSFLSPFICRNHVDIR